MNEIQKKFDELLDKVGKKLPDAPETARIRKVEDIINRCLKHAHRDAEDQQTYLDWMHEVDVRMAQHHHVEFAQSPRVTAAYQQLRPMKPETFWEKGLPRFRDVRDEIWTLVQEKET